MTDKVEFKYWKESGHILVGDCFLRNESLNPMINWLNLHRVDIENGDTCEGLDKINEVTYVSMKGFVTIVTHRDMVILKKSDVDKFVSWLNEHRKVLKIHEVWING
jgi:hypothetical protein